MTWAHPEYLSYFLILPFGVLIYLFRSSWRKRNIKKWFGEQSSFIVTTSSFKRHLKISFFTPCSYIFYYIPCSTSRFREKGRILKEREFR